MAAVFSTYADPLDFITNATAQIETASLVGGDSTLSASCVKGATSLTVASATGFSGTFEAWICDGYNSERLTGCTISGTTITVPSPGTLAAHGSGVSISSPGTLGNLAAVIRRASSWIEAYCRQGPDAGSASTSSDRSLYQMSRTEKLSGPNSYRAYFDVDNQLVLRPYHFPVASVSALSVQMGPTNALSVDTTYLYLPDAARVIEVPWKATLTSPPGNYLWPVNPFPRNVKFVASLTYIGGPCWGTTLDTVPPELKEATYLVTAHFLGYRRNPVGAAMIKQGDVTIEARLRGDPEGKSLLLKDAMDFLEPFRQR